MVARVAFWGWEDNQSTVTSPVNSRAPELMVANGGASWDTTIVRTGRSAGKVIATSGVAVNFTAQNSNASDYNRVYVRVTVRPTTTARGLIGDGSQVTGVNIRLNPDGTLAYFNTTTLIGTSTTALTDTTKWYRVEWRRGTGTSVPVLLIDGNTEVTGSPSAWVGNLNFGATDTVADTYTAYFDDFASDSSAFPGDGGVALLMPTADSARATLWTGAVGGTTNLFDAVNNLPPIGAASASATNLTQIEHAGGATGTTDAYDATMQTYTAAGVPAGATINAVSAVLLTGEDSATGDKLLSHQIISNPVGTSTGSYNVATAGASNAIGTYPTNWFRQAIIDQAPSGIVLGTAPVLRVIRPETATRVASVCFMGILVDFTPAAATGPTETNLARIGLEATGLTLKAALGSALRGSAGFGATCTALKITTGTSRAQSGLRASAIGAKVVTATARAEAGFETKAIAVKSVAGTARAQAGLEVADTAIKAGIGTARVQAGLETEATAVKAGIATARASAGVEAASTESKIGSGTGRATVGIGSTANAAKSVNGTARAETGLESTATASRVAATTATAQGQLGLDATSTAVKAGLATAQAETGLESAGTAQKVGLSTAQAELGTEATATASKTVIVTANATALGSAGLEATAQASKSTAATGRASIGAESTGQAAKSVAGTGQASVGPEAVLQGSKHGAAQAVASVGAQGQCASAVKSSTATARGSVGLRARSVTTLPTPAGAAPKLIWIDGRLALRVSQVIYERL